MNKFLENIKNILTIVIICIAAFFAYNTFQSCVGPKPPPKVVVTPLKTVTPTDAEKAIVPDGHDVLGVLRPVRNPRPDRWERTDTSIVISADSKCNTCTPEYTQNTTTTTFIGFSFEPKFYVGFTNSEVTLGYSQGIARWGRLGLDTLITFPYVGLGVTYNLTNNLSVLLGANTQYIQHEGLENVGSYNFDTNELSKFYPLIGGTFHF